MIFEEGFTVAWTWLAITATMYDVSAYYFRF
jgi:hypothetical protein